MPDEPKSGELPEEPEASIAAAVETAPSEATEPAQPQPLALPEKADIADLKRQIKLLIQSNERLHEMNRRQLFSMSLRMSLLRGTMLGFGWVLGTTVVVTVVIYFMRPFLSVPYIGEMAKQLLEYIEHGR